MFRLPGQERRVSVGKARAVTNSITGRVRLGSVVPVGGGPRDRRRSGLLPPLYVPGQTFGEHASAQGDLWQRQVLDNMGGLPVGAAPASVGGVAASALDSDESLATAEPQAPVDSRTMTNYQI